MHKNPISSVNRDVVLTKALLNLASFYAIQGKDLACIIGISEASATRLAKGKRLISEKTKEGELALLLIRLYRSLNALVGNDAVKAKLWLNSSNRYFSHTTPMECIKRIEGLIEVVNYLGSIQNNYPF